MIMVKKIAAPLIVLMLIYPLMGYAHGTHLKLLKGGIGIEIFYHNNSPMADTDITVYGPENPQKIYLAGKTDQQGRFFFMPSKSGTWTVKASDKTGHAVKGQFQVNIDRTSLVTIKGQEPSISIVQKLLMSLSVIWGCLGTALFFHRKNNDAHK